MIGEKSDGSCKAQECSDRFVRQGTLIKSAIRSGLTVGAISDYTAQYTSIA